MRLCITCRALHTKLQELQRVLVYNGKFLAIMNPFCLNNIIASIISLAAPNPPAVTVTPLYDCGHLLEIKSQATAGVGCDNQ